MLCGCLTLIVLWSKPVNFRECSVLGLWFSDFYSKLSLGMLTGYEKILLKQRKAEKSEGNLAYQILLCLILFPSPSSWIGGPLFFLQIFVSWKIYDFTTISSQLCSLQDRHNSVQYTDTLVPDSLHVIYLVSLSYYYFICSVCFLENIFLQEEIWFKPKLYEGTRRMPAGSG